MHFSICMSLILWRLSFIVFLNEVNFYFSTFIDIDNDGIISREDMDSVLDLMTDNAMNDELKNRIIDGVGCVCVSTYLSWISCIITCIIDICWSQQRLKLWWFKHRRLSVCNQPISRLLQVRILVQYCHVKQLHSYILWVETLIPKVYIVYKGIILCSGMVHANTNWKN